MGFEPTYGGFADPSLTTWVPRPNLVGPHGQIALQDRPRSKAIGNAESKLVAGVEIDAR